MPVLKLCHGIDQGEIERPGLDGTSHDVGNGQSPYCRTSGRQRCEVFVGLPREQRLLQVSLQRSKRLSEVGEVRRLENEQVQGASALTDAEYMGCAAPSRSAASPKWSPFVHVTRGAAEASSK